MKKAQSLIMQFVLFFIIGFTLFITIGSFFKSQSDAFRIESTEYNIRLANSYLSSFAIGLIDTCKSCDYASVQINVENTTAGYYFLNKLDTQGLDISTSWGGLQSISSIHNLNSSVTLTGNSSSAKTIYLTFNRSQNVLYFSGVHGLPPLPTTTTSSTTTSSTTSSTTTTTLPPWLYRKPVTISNSLSALSDYQVLATADTTSLISAGKMRSDCGDVRFRDSDGIIDLSYWNETACNSASTKFWVKVPSIPSGTKTIYMYYGNSSASSLSNGTATFVFFDDFESGNLNKWDTKANWGDQTSVVQSGTYAAHALSVSNLLKRNHGLSSYTYVIEFWMRSPVTSDYFYAYNGYDTTYSANVYFWNTGYIGYYTTTFNNICTYAANTWYKIKLVTNSSSNYQIYVYNADGSLRGSVTGAAYRSYNAGQSFWFNPNNALAYVDNVIIRKYASPEPVTLIGAEEII
jgi:hypothetical protein